MASLSDITQKIIADAQARADAIACEGDRQAEQVYADAREEVAQKRAELAKAAEQKAAVRKERLLAAAELDGKKKILETKQAILAQAFDQAVASIVRLEDKEYEQLMARMAKQAEGTVEQLPRDKEKGTGGGFIVKNGNIELNYSLEALAKTAKDRMEKELVSMLFE